MCTRRKGCCGTSLQRTCLVIGIVYLVWNIIIFMYLFMGSTGHSVVAYESVVRLYSHRSLGYVTITNLIFSIIAILICISLILAASFENENLLFPWFIGYAATIVQFIIAIGFLASNHGSYLDFKWDLDDDYSSYNSGNLRGSLELSRHNGTQHSIRYEFKSYFSVWNIYESFVKILIESCLLCYPISYYVELRRSD